LNIYQDISHVQHDIPEIRARLLRLQSDADWLVQRPVWLVKEAVGDDSDVTTDAIVECHLLLRRLEI